MVFNILFGRDEENVHGLCWECPDCNRAMTRETAEDLRTQGIFEYCPGCGEPTPPETTKSLEFKSYSR